MRDIDDYTKKYHTEPGEYYQALYRKKLVIDVLKRYKHENVLEIGCGLDPLFSHIDSYNSMTIVDPSEEFIKNATELSKNDPRIQCVKGFFEKCVNNNQVKKGKYDYIVCSSLLHELENPEDILLNIKKICNKDSIVHFNVPNAKSIHRLLAVEMGLISDIYQLSNQQIEMQRQRVYDADSFAELVTGCGFEVIESGSYYPKFFSGSQMDLMLENGIITEKVFDGLYGMGKYLENYGSEIYINARLSE